MSSKPPRYSKHSTSRGQTTRVKTAKGRKLTSTIWLQRQLNDPYVQRAKEDGYRSRAAYKLLEIDEKYQLFSKKSIVIDLGAAPGGWTQVAVERTSHPEEAPGVMGIDLLDMEPIPGAYLLKGDIFELETAEAMQEFASEKADVLLSDMAPLTCGHPATDHLRSVALVEEVIGVMPECLKRGGHLLVKLFRGGEEEVVKKDMQKHFKKVHTIKPEASRKGSTEIYLLGLDYS